MLFFCCMFVDMNVLGLDLTWPVWTRNKAGDHFYDITSVGDWASPAAKLEMAQNHPILTPALLFVAKLFSQATFKVTRDSTGKSVGNHPLLELFKNPNHFQTGPDLLESLLFTQLANGVGVLYTKKTFGTDLVNALYVLNYALIEWPEDLKKGHFKNRSAAEAILKRKVIYDKNGENLEIELGDLLFFYDMPNAINKNPFSVKSRLDGLQQTLINTHDSLTAKNIILKSNGKEMISGNKDGFPMDPDEKEDAELLLNHGYGLSRTRKRGLLTKANVTWKSLHIALRDLGLDESVKVDGNLIYTALHIPKDILSLEAKKTTYNNFKESMVSYIQNEIQTTLNSTLAVFNKIVGKGFTLEGDYEHMPIMQYVLLERYKAVQEQAKALDALRRAGIEDKLALEMCGFEGGTKIGPLIQQNNANGTRSQETDPQTSTGTKEESRVRRLS